MYVMHVIESGFDILPLLGIIAVASFLFWVDHKLERPVTKQSIKKTIKETTKK